MNPFNRFTIKAQESLQRAQDLTVAESHGEFNALHLLSALFADSESLVRPMLSQGGINLEKLDEIITDELKKLPKVFSATSVGQLYLSQEVMKVIDQAAKSAAANSDEFISCEHLLLGILSVDSPARALLEKHIRQEGEMIVPGQAYQTVRNGWIAPAKKGSQNTVPGAGLNPAL